MSEESFKNVYQFKITLDDIRPPIWRRIQVPETYNFKELHLAIQMSMGWKDCHLHNFKIKNVTISMHDQIDDDYGIEDELDERKTCIKDWFKKPLDCAMYEYDFGDGWDHIIQLEKIEPAQPGVQYPRCTGGERACPPEDCGGTFGYEKLLHILKTPSEEEHDEKKMWLDRRGYGKSFDPEKFSADDIFANWDD